MKIGIISSMHHTERMVEIRDILQSKGHSVVISKFADAYIGKNDEEKESIKLFHKNERDAIREFWAMMQDLDAVLVLNLERHGIPNYIGGNTLMEIGFAHVLNLKIFLYNPIPEIPYYKTEIAAVRPVIIDGNLDLIQ